MADNSNNGSSDFRQRFKKNKELLEAQRKKEEKVAKKFFFIFSLVTYGLSFFISIFIVVQSHIVLMFFKDNKIKGKGFGEKILFERFGYEIFHSLNKTLIPKYEIKKKCTKNEIADYFGIKLGSFFDCRNVFDSSLNKKVCRDQITPNYTCCLPECCNYTLDNEGNNVTKCNNLDYESIFNSDVTKFPPVLSQESYDKFITNDPRKKHCKYYNKYSSNFSVIYGKYFCKPEIYPGSDKKLNDSELSYENLLKHSVNLDDRDIEKDTKNFEGICEDGYKPCGILDTYNNILCLPKEYECPLSDVKFSKNNDMKLIGEKYSETVLTEDLSIYQYNEENINKPIFIYNLFTELPPLSHEWDNDFPLKPNKSEDYDERFKNFTTKNIDFLKYFYDPYYKKINFTDPDDGNKEKEIGFLLGDIYNWNIFDKYYSLNPYKNITNEYQNLFWYHKNFIGFKNGNSTQNFRKLFDHNIYYMSKINQRKLLTDYSLGVFFIYALIIAGFITITVLDFKKNEDITGFRRVCIVFNMIINIFALPLYFISVFVFNYWFYYKKINMKSDFAVNEILDLYHYRRSLNYLLTSLCIMLVNFALDLFFVIAVLVYPSEEINNTIYELLKKLKFIKEKKN